MKHTNGFTLIELLVVVAIIGLLATIVVGSLNTARGRAGDARVKANLASLRNQAELFYTVNGNYGADYAAATCPTSGHGFFYGDQTAREIIQESDQYGSVTCAADNGSAAAGSASSWAVSAPLNDGGSWCVDSTGAAASGTAAIASNEALCQ